MIQSADPGGWYAQVGLYFDTPKITVYLPESQYRTLTVTGSTGAIELPEAFTFERAEITSSTGNAVFCAAVSGAASIQTATGDIRAKHTSADALNLTVTTGAVHVSDVTCQNDLTVSVSTGKAYLRNVSCGTLLSTGSVGSIALDHVTAANQISIERSTGHVELAACDASELHLKTDTGDVTGSLLSDTRSSSQRAMSAPSTCRKPPPAASARSGRIRERSQLQSTDNTNRPARRMPCGPFRNTSVCTLVN